MFDALLLVWFVASAGLFTVCFQRKKQFSRWQSLLTTITVGLYSLFSVSVLLVAPGLWKLFAVSGIFHAINAARLLKMRAEYSLLRTKVIVAFWKLLILEVILFVSLSYVAQEQTPPAYLLIVVNVIVGLFAAFALVRLLWHYFKSRLPRAKKNSIDELPSVSILVPARNEDHVLESCLSSLMDIDYPKLEVLVLDDCSQDKTPEIIAKFAHEGVRFISGAPPSENWLGKNHAYEQLAVAASGELLVFSEVDVRFSAHSITQIARAYQNSKYSMLSVLPQRYGGDFPGSWLYSLTDLWRLIGLPRPDRQTTSTDAVFAIKASELKRLGSFRQARKAINPIQLLARQLNRWGAYKFVVSDKRLGISVRKRYNSIIDNAQRRSYAESGSDPAHTLLICIGLLTILGMAFASLLTPEGWMLYILFASVLGLYQFMTLEHSNHFTRFTHFGIGLLFPIHLAIEFYVQLMSLINYEFRELTWKQRLVCYPIYKEFTKIS